MNPPIDRTTIDRIAAMARPKDWSWVGKDRRHIRRDVKMLARAARDGWLDDPAILHNATDRLLALVKEIDADPVWDRGVKGGLVCKVLAAAAEVEQAAHRIEYLEVVRYLREQMKYVRLPRGYPA